MSLRETLYRERDGEAIGTGVFVGAQYNGFPEDSYNNDNISSPINYRNSFLLDNRWANLLRIGKEDVDLEGELEINGYTVEDINDELEAEGNGEMTVINTKFFNKELVDIGREYGLSAQESWQKIMDEGVNVINPPSIADACNSKAATYDIFESSGVTAPPWFDMNQYVNGGGLEELYTDIERFRDTYNFTDGPEGDIPVVLKPYNGSGGLGIETTTLNRFLNRAENEQSLEKYLEKKSERAKDETDKNKDINPSKWMIQYAVPAKFDQRVITGNGVIHTSSIREGEGLIHNMDNGASAAPVERSEISDGIENIVGEAEEALVNAVEPHENSGRYLGWDVLGFDPHDPLLDDFPQYQQFLFDELVHDENFLMEVDGMELYGVPGEANDSPGYKIDDANSEFPYQNSCLALMKLAEDISRGRKHTRVGKDQLHPKIRKDIKENDFTFPPGPGQNSL